MANDSRREIKVTGTRVQIKSGHAFITPWKFILNTLERGGMSNSERENYLRSDLDAVKIRRNRAVCKGCGGCISLVSSMNAADPQFNANSWLSHKLTCDDMQCVLLTHLFRHFLHGLPVDRITLINLRDAQPELARDGPKV